MMHMNIPPGIWIQRVDRLQRAEFRLMRERSLDAGRAGLVVPDMDDEIGHADRLCWRGAGMLRTPATQ